MALRVGIVGYGSLGQFLVKAIQERDDLQLAFVWNRNVSALQGQIDSVYILEDLSQFAGRKADLIVEVAHPDISAQYGVDFVKSADYMIGSPTALANQEVETMLRQAATNHGIYIPSGALWGGEDILKMADRGTLTKLKVTMKKHPDSFKLNGVLKEKNSLVTDKCTILYEDSVRGLCPLAPNNVNTMAAACMAGHNLGFDQVVGCLVSDPDLTAHHIVEIEVWGAGGFHCKTVRTNPAVVGKVTGSATYGAFLSSILRARGKGSGLHLC